MKEEQLRLKRRMQLKRMEIKIQKAAEENFGYDPSYDWYHKLLETRSALSDMVSSADHNWWLVFEEYRYNENCKSLPVFI